MRQIYLIRHGQTEYNRDQKFQGVSDSPLTAEGRAQVEKWRLFFRNLSLETIYCSPLKRCLITAYKIADDQRIAVDVNPLLREVSYGDWEGKEKRQMQNTDLWRQRQKDRFKFIHPGQFGGVKGESYHNLYNRLVPFWRRLEQSTMHTVLIVAHLGVMITAKKYFLGLDDGEIADYTPKNNIGICVSLNHKVTLEEMTL